MSIQTKLDYICKPAKFLNYQFIPNKYGYYDIYNIAENTHLGVVRTNMDGNICIDIDSAYVNIITYEKVDIENEFKIYSEWWPTYYVCANTFGDKEYYLQDLPNWYENMIAAVAMLRSDWEHINEESKLHVCKNINKIINWCRSTDLYTAPASTVFHESHKGGLLLHTYNVTQQILELYKLNKFENVELSSSLLVALVHDWCKIGLYEPFLRNVKNADTGMWEQVESYKRKDFYIPLGHGVQSMYISNRFFKLSMEECLAIRWHMGRWNVADSELNELQQANEQYPLVHMLQFADCLAITRY